VNKPAVVITGCHGGIGRALVRHFHAAAFWVIGIDLASGSAETDVFIQADFLLVINNPSEQKLFSKRLNKALEGKALKGLVNNAAVQILGDTEAISVEQFRQSLDINVVAPFLLSQLCLQYLKAAQGVIINIGSIHNQLTKPGFVAYATSKGALDTMTKAMAVDIGREVPVNAVAPAAIATEMLTHGFEDNPAGLTQLESFHPSGRIGMPTEVAELVYFLVTTKASFINGATIEMTGGIAGRLHDPA